MSNPADRPTAPAPIFTWLGPQDWRQFAHQTYLGVGGAEWRFRRRPRITTTQVLAVLEAMGQLVVKVVELRGYSPQCRGPFRRALKRLTQLSHPCTPALYRREALRRLRSLYGELYPRWRGEEEAVLVFASALAQVLLTTSRPTYH